MIDKSVWERLERRDRRRRIGARIAKITAIATGACAALCMACLIYLSCRGVTLFAKLRAPDGPQHDSIERACEYYKRCYRDSAAGAVLLELTYAGSSTGADGAEIITFHKTEYRVLPSPAAETGRFDSDAWHIDIKVTPEDCTLVAEGYG